MREEYLEPARTVVAILDGINNAAQAAQTDRSWVNRWLLPKEKGGTGGIVPSKYHQRLLDWAAEHEKPLEPKHFFVQPHGVSKRRPSRVAA